MEGTLRGLAIGLTLGAMLGGYFGYQYGYRAGGGQWSKPEFKIILATVVLILWALAQLLSLLFATEVDTWLNVMMGTVAGFFFGDGVVENFSKGKGGK